MLGRVVIGRLVRGIGGRLPTGRQVLILAGICGRVLRLLLLVVRVAGSWDRIGGLCVRGGWGPPPCVARIVFGIVRTVFVW